MVVFLLYLMFVMIDSFDAFIRSGSGNMPKSRGPSLKRPRASGDDHMDIENHNNKKKRRLDASGIICYM